MAVRQGVSTAAQPVAAPAATVGPAQRELLRELTDLKRVRSAGREGSLAARLFRAAWSMLVGGTAVEEVAERVTAAAVAAARLGDLDAAKLRALGLSAEDATAVLARGFDELAEPVPEPLRSRLRAALANAPVDRGSAPPFVALLEAQPRAGVTCPGKPRLMLEPAESHADHCLAVAVGGALLAPLYGADPPFVFLAGLAHHLHNALMPDSGFTGEMLLGDALGPVIDAAREQALAELHPFVRSQIVAVLEPIAGSDTPEARAFHAADVIDRVLEIAGHLRGASATMDTVLVDYELVHAGPVKTFHDQVLGEAGLL